MWALARTKAASALLAERERRLVPPVLVAVGAHRLWGTAIEACLCHLCNESCHAESVETREEIRKDEHGKKRKRDP